MRFVIFHQLSQAYVKIGLRFLKIRQLLEPIQQLGRMVVVAGGVATFEGLLHWGIYDLALTFPYINSLSYRIRLCSTGPTFISISARRARKRL